MAKCVVLVERCVGCGECVVVCPNRAMSLQDKAHIDLEKCSGCAVCMRTCRYGAIEKIEID
ncbi:ferredoxin [Methanosarcinales archaeon]|nr:MAG: ferredoxin [Methanosarcinales archaeon]